MDLTIIHMHTVACPRDSITLLVSSAADIILLLGFPDFDKILHFDIIYASGTFLLVSAISNRSRARKICETCSPLTVTSASEI